MGLGALSSDSRNCSEEFSFPPPLSAVAADADALTREICGNRNDNSSIKREGLSEDVLRPLWLLLSTDVSPL